MISFSFSEIKITIDALDLLKRAARSESYQDKGRQRELITKTLIPAIDNMIGHAGDLALIQTKGRCVRFKQILEDSLAPLLPSASHIPGASAIKADNLTPPEIAREIEGVINAATLELADKKFAFIPPGKDEYFEQAALFGEKVNDAFPSAENHIKAAGNCLAADLNTAAVYHLMCVVNVGLLALAKHLKLTKIKAIEYQEWKNIIDGLKKKVDTANQKPKGKKKQDELEFYSALLLEFSAFKDVYRNNMAHARASYRFHEAKGVYDRVRDFMRRLAAKVSE
jgi:hypothetical protein